MYIFLIRKGVAMKKVLLGLACMVLFANALKAMDSTNTGSTSNGGYEGSGMDNTQTSGGWGSGVGNDNGGYGSNDTNGGMDNTTTGADSK
jgi:hypothetical protein